MSETTAAEAAAALEAVAASIPRPQDGLPDAVFRFALRIVPMVNVDLFVVDAERRVLLAWREDEFADGWHVPGGIVRGGEAVETRLALTAEGELGALVRAEETPAAILQLFGERGHFISLVHRCTLRSAPARRLVSPSERPAHGDLCWFDDLPRSLYPTHAVYRALWDDLRSAARLQAPLAATLHVSERDQGSRGWRPG